MKKSGFFKFFLFLSLFSLTSCQSYSFENWQSGYQEKTIELERMPDASFLFSDLGKQDEGEYTPTISSLGKSNILVVPVEFLDFKFPSNYEEVLENTFNGPSDYFYSVHDYYDQSSFSKLDLHFEIAPKYEVNLSSVEFMKGNTARSRKSVSLLRRVVSSYRSSYDYSSFDQDNDGFIDAVYLIYSAPPYEQYDYHVLGLNEEEYSDFWAYTFLDYNAEKNTNNPVGKSFIWCSYSFLNQKGGDAHTLIHETGHLFGLPDLYNTAMNNDVYKEKEKYRMPLGGLDMMDLGLGDHNAWTKYALGWKNPYYVYDSSFDSFTIELEEGESVFLLPKESELSPYVEGILFEFMDTNHLNQWDANERYLGEYPYFYSLPGIRVIHVDARITKARRNGNLLVKGEYVKNLTKEDFSLENGFYTLGADNNPTSSKEDVFSFLKLIEADNKNDLDNLEYPQIHELHYADNRDLFIPETGKNIFSMEKYKSSFVEDKPFLNSGASLSYEVKVNGIKQLNTKKYASLTFSCV